MANGIIKRFDVYWVQLDPAVGSEIKKTRPCVVISPNELHFLKTCIIAPLTSKKHGFPSRVLVTFQGTEGEIALDQLRSVDSSRLIKKMGALSATTAKNIISVLLEMFDE
ncbi:MAG: type II toxin-antitoxin system PemK/MazF family toxin [Pseudomonadota bacterium]